MGSEIPQIHVFFFPFMAHGHMIPAVDIAKLFSTHGVKTTIITTPLNASYLSKTIERSNESGLDIGIKTIKFPSAEAGLAEGIENADSIQGNSPQSMELLFKFIKATSLLQEPFQQLLQECKPDCLVSDMFFPWSTDVATKLGILNLVFHGTSAFALCATECVRTYEPYKKVESDIEPFVIPNLPGDIKLTKQQIPDFLKQDVETDFTRMVKASKEAEKKSYGVIVNSFYELEKTYADYYRNVLGKRTWHIGPVSLCNRATEDKAVRGKASAIDEHECLKWLDTKKLNSVIYICFGSMANFTSDQLKEIAIALESSEQQFIWVVRRQNNNEEDEDWLPDQEYEKRMEGKGLIIRGWAPQVLILDHEAIGGFVTHCGWNSTLEGVCAGVPMVTWPVAAEQFYNEKLLTDVLKIGVSVGAKQWKRTTGDFVRRELIEKAVREIMKGDEVEEMRKKAKTLAEEAKKAVEIGGSSYNDLNALIEELSLHRRH